MIRRSPKEQCVQSDRLAVYALHVLPDEDAKSLEAHVATCRFCQAELDELRPIVDCFVDRGSDSSLPPDCVRERLARRIANETGRAVVLPTTRSAAVPDWREVAPGISCKLLATDAKRERVSMLVRLAPGVAYPPHEHAGVEELHLLDGELWIDDRKLCAGDYNRAEPGTIDRRVWSETGCTCVLITSLADVLR